MSDRYTKLFATLTDDTFWIHDDRGPDEMNGPLDRLNRILSEEFVKRGDAFFRQAPNLRNHKLNKAQIHNSVQPYGDCYRLVPAKHTDTEAFSMVVTVPGTLGKETRTIWVKRQPLPTREALEEILTGLSDENFHALRMKYGAANLEMLLNRMPHQGRGGIILGSEANYQSGNDYIDNMSYELLVKTLDAFRAIIKAQTDKEKPNAADVKLFSEFMSAVRESKGLQPDDIWTVLEKSVHRCKLQLEILGYDADEDPMQKYDPEPLEPKDWALPFVVLQNMNCKADWNIFLESGFAYTRRELRLFGEKMGEDIFPHNEFNADKFPSYEEVLAQVEKVREAHSLRHEAWRLRRDPASLWENMGTIVSNVTSSDDGELQDDNGFWPSWDARPKPGIAHGPAAFMNPEEEYYVQVLSAASTPEDDTLYSGDAGPFANRTPVIRRKAGDGDYIYGGHPLSRWIQDFMEACDNPIDTVQVNRESTFEEVLILNIPSRMPLHKYVSKGRDGLKRELLYFDIDGGRAFICYNDDGTPIMSKTSTNTVRVKAVCRYYAGDPAKTLTCKVWSKKYKRWFTPNNVKRDPAFAPYRELKVDELPFELTWDSTPAYMRDQIPHVMVKTIEVVQDENTGEDIIAVVERPAGQVFPILCLFFKLLAEEYESEVGGMKDFYFETRRGQHDMFEAVWKELRSYQKAQLKKLVDWNYHMVEDLVMRLEEGFRAVCSDGDSFNEHIWEDVNGEATSLYRALFDSNSGHFWTTVRRISGKNSELRLPKAKDALELLEAMGYLYVNYKKFPTFDIIRQMVEREFLRSNVADDRRFTVDGRPHMVNALYPVDNPSPALFSCGLLGDLKARLLMAMFGVEKNSFFNAGFRPSWEHIQSAPDIEAAIRLCVMEMFPVQFWGREFQSKAFRVFCNWGRAFRENWKSETGRQLFFEKLLEHFEPPRFRSKKAQTTDEVLDSLFERAKKMEKGQRAFRRLALSATNPTLTLRVIKLGLNPEMRRKVGKLSIDRLMAQTKGSHGSAEPIVERMFK